MSKKKQAPLSEHIMWYTVIASGLIFLGAIAPVTPWRYAKMDAGMGNRFVMQRYYSLMGPTDSYGARVGWLTLASKIHRKVEEYYRPSPTNALLGTVTTMMGTGGAAMGCVSWEVCKAHIKSRYYQYYYVGILSICCMVGLAISALGCIGTILCYNYEDEKEDQKLLKKKKKKSDDGPCDFHFTMKQKTCICAMTSCFFSSASTVAFCRMTDSMLHEFRSSAAYPFATAHAGAYAAGLACFLMFANSLFLWNRWAPFCPKKEEPETDGEEWAGPLGGKGSNGEWQGAGESWHSYKGKGKGKGGWKGEWQGGVGYDGGETTEDAGWYPGKVY